MAFNSTIPLSVLDQKTRTTIGSALVGNQLNWFLLGGLSVQMYIYMNNKHSHKDPIWLRALVCSVFVVDLAQTVVGTHYAWYYSVEIWGNPTALLTAIPWSGWMVPILDGFIALLVQSFYAWRIWTLSRSRSLYLAPVALIVLLSLMQFIASMVVTIKEFSNDGSRAALQVVTSSADVWLVGSFANDVIIAACMVTLLYQARTQTVWVQSQGLYDRLIANTVQTGLVTATIAGVDLLLWERYRTKDFYIAPALILGKLYSNSFLSTLNGRIFRRKQLNSRSDNLSGTGTNDSGNGLQIHVMQDREQRIEGGNLSQDGPVKSWKQKLSVAVGKDQDEQTYQLSTLSPRDSDQAGKHTSIA
ncbi:hypothetical protein PENSPDRAFT_752456 [Peniophora sp. CONT]|nr:hypothetical protein PENSPDRAFT_752456 [Peniophora sp. CONT]